MAKAKADAAPEDWDGPDWTTLDLVQRRGYRNKLAFLKAFARDGIILTGCESTGVSRTSIYRWLETDDWFKKKFADAEEQAADVLEREAHRRAAIGVDEPVTFQGQPTFIPNPNDPMGAPIMFTVKKYSDPLMQMLLKGRRPGKYGDKSKVEVSGQMAPVLVVPGALSPDEWAKMAKDQQAKYAGNTGETDDKG